MLSLDETIPKSILKRSPMQKQSATQIGQLSLFLPKLHNFKEVGSRLAYFKQKQV